MIFVAAGHGPPPVLGVVWQGFAEHTEAVLWRNAIAEHGVKIGAPIESVPVLRLKEKVAHINQRCRETAEKCIAVDLHFNAGGTPGVTRGCEVLYAPGSNIGMMISNTVLSALSPLFPPSRGSKEAWYKQDHPHRVDFPGDVDGDEKPDYFCVATLCPALIIESAFIYEREAIEARRTAACVAIAKSLVQAHFLLSSRGLNARQT